MPDPALPEPALLKKIVLIRCFSDTLPLSKKIFVAQVHHAHLDGF
jgi:hypothetical protein